MKKLICFILIFSMLFSFVSCAPKATVNEEKNNTPVPDDTPLDEEDAAYLKYKEDKSQKETTAYVKEKYSGIDYDGYSFRILNNNRMIIL